MTELRIVETIPAHCVEMAAKMRAGDRAECEAGGLTVRKAIWRSYRRSLIVRTAYINGDLAAIFGMGGDVMAETGAPWLFTTGVVERFPLLFVRAALAAVNEMLLVKTRLESYVSADYPQACRFLASIGFTLGDPEPFGPKAAPFRKYSMSVT